MSPWCAGLAEAAKALRDSRVLAIAREGRMCRHPPFHRALAAPAGARQRSGPDAAESERASRLERQRVGPAGSASVEPEGSPRCSLGPGRPGESAPLWGLSSALPVLRLGRRRTGLFSSGPWPRNWVPGLRWVPEPVEGPRRTDQGRAAPVSRSKSTVHSSPASSASPSSPLVRFG